MAVEDRRPIATRELAISARLARALVRAGWTANGISVLGMFAGVLSGVTLFLTATHAEHARWWFVASAALVQLRLLANMLDGMVAVEGQQISPVGEMYNEIPDRVSDTATLIGLGYALGGHVLAGFAAATAAVFCAYVRAQAKVAGAPQDYCGPFAKPHRMFVVTLLCLYMALSPVGWQPTWEGHGLPAAAAALLTVGALFTAVRRMLRAGRRLRGHA